MTFDRRGRAALLHLLPAVTEPCNIPIPFSRRWSPRNRHERAHPLRPAGTLPISKPTPGPPPPGPSHAPRATVPARALPPLVVAVPGCSGERTHRTRTRRATATRPRTCPDPRRARASRPGRRPRPSQTPGEIGAGGREGVRAARRARESGLFFQSSVDERRARTGDRPSPDAPPPSRARAHSRTSECVGCAGGGGRRPFSRLGRMCQPPSRRSSGRWSAPSALRESPARVTDRRRRRGAGCPADPARATFRVPRSPSTFGLLTLRATGHSREGGAAAGRDRAQSVAARRWRSHTCARGVSSAKDLASPRRAWARARGTRPALWSLRSTRDPSRRETWPRQRRNGPCAKPKGAGRHGASDSPSRLRGRRRSGRVLPDVAAVGRAASRLGPVQCSGMQRVRSGRGKPARSRPPVGPGGRPWMRCVGRGTAGEGREGAAGGVLGRKERFEAGRLARSNVQRRERAGWPAESPRRHGYDRAVAGAQRPRRIAGSHSGRLRAASGENLGRDSGGLAARARRVHDVLERRVGPACATHSHSERRKRLGPRRLLLLRAPPVPPVGWTDHPLASPHDLGPLLVFAMDWESLCDAAWGPRGSRRRRTRRTGPSRTGPLRRPLARLERRSRPVNHTPCLTLPQPGYAQRGLYADRARRAPRGPRVHVTVPAVRDGPQRAERRNLRALSAIEMVMGDGRWAKGRGRGRGRGGRGDEGGGRPGDAGWSRCRRAPQRGPSLCPPSHFALRTSRHRVHLRVHARPAGTSAQASGCPSTADARWRRVGVPPEMTRWASTREGRKGVNPTLLRRPPTARPHLRAEPRSEDVRRRESMPRADGWSGGGARGVQSGLEPWLQLQRPRSPSPWQRRDAAVGCVLIATGALREGGRRVAERGGGEGEGSVRERAAAVSRDSVREAGGTGGRKRGQSPEWMSIWFGLPKGAGRRTITGGRDAAWDSRAAPGTKCVRSSWTRLHTGSTMESCTKRCEYFHWKTSVLRKEDARFMQVDCATAGKRRMESTRTGAEVKKARGDGDANDNKEQAGAGLGHVDAAEKSWRAKGGRRLIAFLEGSGRLLEKRGRCDRDRDYAGMREEPVGGGGDGCS
ncbi:uncharacterized protein BXZ73DRAFT_77712 [Epithele typhae]|uniref:uncharacterized protein n=1 Tax=Epithele typhae TaxID=378194 RepID=UPI002007E386|nr:uncharacterized protein BXZ73DRAFT_77712 [Epithele typhae]KAH9931688.1 hypothetical protein BXZ73DRAFT_77712 [Epithele typhae]